MKSHTRGVEGPHKLVSLAATMLCLGYAPIAPGTAGSAGAVIIYLFICQLNPYLYELLWIFLFIVSCGVAHSYFRAVGRDDPSEVVIDEAVGFLAAMFLLPPTAGYVVAAFLLFRLFDIIKPWPARYFDRKIKNGFGIVMDDVMAGVYANVVIQVFRYFSG
ncbi:MAG: phosphatidylglycerophosphatase A [bacterium]